MYHHTKNEVSMSTGSKVIAWTDTQTQRKHYLGNNFVNALQIHILSIQGEGDRWLIINNFVNPLQIYILSIQGGSTWRGSTVNISHEKAIAFSCEKVITHYWPWAHFTWKDYHLLSILGTFHVKRQLPIADSGGGGLRELCCPTICVKHGVTTSTSNKLKICCPSSKALGGGGGLKWNFPAQFV